MATQKQVGGIALGVPGTLYGHNPATFYLPTPLAGASGVLIGNFAWPDTDGKMLNSGAGAPAGVVVRVRVQPLPSDKEGTMLIPAGHAAPVLVRGPIILASSSAASVGQKVFASLTTGAPSTAAAGATVAGSVETDFTVRTPAAAGAPFVATRD